MKKILILGSSPAGVKAAEIIRRTDKESEITILAFEESYPYVRERFPALLSKEIDPKEIFYKPKDFYEKNQIKLLLNKKLSRVNLKRNRVTTEDKEQLDYDVLLITDLPLIRFPEIKGTNKAGVFGLKRYQDIDAILNVSLLTDTVILQSQSFWGLQIACGLLQKGKEVLWVSPGKSLIPSLLSTDISAHLQKILEGKGLRVLLENSIVEILGDAEAKAVRLKSGKVMGSSLIIFDDTSFDMRDFLDFALEVDEKIFVDGQGKTNLENVFALDYVAEEREQGIFCDDYRSLNTLEAQGEAVAATIEGKATKKKDPPSVRTIKFQDLTLTLLGEIPFAGDVREYQTFDEAKNTYKKIFFKNGILKGVFLLNAEENREQLLRFLAEKQGLITLRNELLDDTLDYERVLNEDKRVKDSAKELSETIESHETSTASDPTVIRS